MRILQGYDVGSAKICVAQEISPHLCLDVKPFDRIVSKDIARVLQRNDMSIVGKDLEGDRIHHLPFVILADV